MSIIAKEQKLYMHSPHGVEQFTIIGMYEMSYVHARIFLRGTWKSTLSDIIRMSEFFK